MVRINGTSKKIESRTTAGVINASPVRFSLVNDFFAVTVFTFIRGLPFFLPCARQIFIYSSESACGRMMVMMQYLFGIRLEIILGYSLVKRFFHVHSGQHILNCRSELVAGYRIIDRYRTGLCRVGKLVLEYA